MSGKIEIWKFSLPEPLQLINALDNEVVNWKNEHWNSVAYWSCENQYFVTKGVVSLWLVTLKIYPKKRYMPNYCSARVEKNKY